MRVRVYIYAPRDAGEAAACGTLQLIWGHMGVPQNQQGRGVPTNWKGGLGTALKRSDGWTFP